MEDQNKKEHTPLTGYSKVSITNVPMQDIMDLETIRKKTGVPVSSLLRPKIKEILKENERYLPKR